MYKLANIRLAPLGNSIYIKPFKMFYEQNGVEKTWDMMEIHDSHIQKEDRHKSICTKKYPADLGITVELCAGIKDKDKPLVQIAQEEVLEECGYDVPLENFEKIHAWNASVGISGNVVTMFYCQVTDCMKVSAGGGVGDEIIDVIEMSVDECQQYMKKDILPSPGSLLAGLYWFLLMKYKKEID